MFYAEFNLRLLLFMLRCKATLLGAVDLDTVPAVNMAARLRRKKWVFDSHEYFTETPEVCNRPLVKRMWNMVAASRVKRSTIAYTVNHSLATMLAAAYKKPFAVVRNMPLKYECQVAANVRPVVLYQGALNKSRGLEELILAMHTVDAECWLAGTGDLDEHLKALAKQNGLEKKVVFLGRKSPEELRQLTGQATIGYNVLQNDGLSYHHSLSNKFFDYVQAGVPSLSSPFPEYECLLAEFRVGLTCICKPEKISEALNTMLQNHTLMVQMREQCLLASTQWNWENEAQTLINLYDGI